MYFYRIVCGVYEDQTTDIVAHERELTEKQFWELLREQQKTLGDKATISNCLEKAGFKELPEVGTFYFSEAFIDGDEAKVLEKDILGALKDSQE